MPGTRTVCTYLTRLLRRFSTTVTLIYMKTFLTVVSVIALAVGVMAMGFPAQLLLSKGATVSDAAIVWVREVGVQIFALSITAWLMRSHPPSPTLRAFFVGNTVVQYGLLPIEISAWMAGTLTNVSGIVPNSILHVVLGTIFLVLARRMRPAPKTVRT
jgi:hypothetical protein